MKSFPQSASIVIAGSGILGLSIARELLRRGHEDIVILEKEEKLGQHASGRNSGVLHAGLYYGKDSLKAKFCLQGNRLLKTYCLQRGLPFLQKGKVIITKSEGEIPALLKLYQNSLDNQVPVQILDEATLKDYEPFAQTIGKALYSPETTVVSPKIILNAIQQELESTKKLRVFFTTSFQKCLPNKKILTNRGPLEYRYFINASGAHADTLAHQFGLGRDYKILPFKGRYKKLSLAKSHLVQSNIYPVPDPRFPFLGIHFTRSLEGEVTIGPTATPAFGRENYTGFSRPNLSSLQILCRMGRLYLQNSLFRQLTREEILSYNPNHFFQEAKKMIPSLNPSDIEISEKVGIRPQLIHRKTMKLEMDFVIEKDENSLHILNAISPAFTCSFAFAPYIVDLMSV